MRKASIFMLELVSRTGNPPKAFLFKRLRFNTRAAISDRTMAQAIRHWTHGQRIMVLNPSTLKLTSSLLAGQPSVSINGVLAWPHALRAVFNSASKITRIFRHLFLLLGGRGVDPGVQVQPLWHRHLLLGLGSHRV